VPEAAVTVVRQDSTDFSLIVIVVVLPCIWLLIVDKNASKH
jgi:hypothetical protein